MFLSHIKEERRWFRAGIIALHHTKMPSVFCCFALDTALDLLIQRELWSTSHNNYILSNSIIEGKEWVFTLSLSRFSRNTTPHFLLKLSGQELLTQPLLVEIQVRKHSLLAGPTKCPTKIQSSLTEGGNLSILIDCIDRYAICICVCVQKKTCKKKCKIKGYQWEPVSKESGH